MIKCNDLYDYGYYIYQNDDYFKFSIDSILLVEFVNIKKKKTVLDMCTGNAPIPQILTTKNPNLLIDCVEIQKEVYELGKMSIEKNKFDNINIINEDIKNYKTNKKYDIVICNPPYFKIDEKSELNQNEVKRIARHEVYVTLDEILNKATKLLDEKGNFYLVQRSERFIETVDLCRKNKLGIRKICFVFTKSKENAELFLLEASKYKKTDPKITYINVENMKSYKNIFE